MDVKKIFVILLGIGALSSIVYALTDFRPGADIDLQNWYGIKNILNITDSDGFTVYGNVSLNNSLNMLQKDVFNITNVNTTNVYVSGTITDGTLSISSGSITEAVDVNCTNIHATNYNLVEDDIPTLSSTWDNTMDADRLTGLDYLNNRITILLNNITGGILGINVDLGGYDVYNATNVNATNIHTTNLYATNLETNLDGTGYDIVAENINASNFYDDGTNLNDKFIDESGDTVSASSLFNWALSNLINITDLNATNVYQNGNKVLDTGTTFGGEVSGTYNNIIIDDNALDDQYFDSESDLTALLDDNYVDVSGDTMSGNLNMNNYNITGANLISATKLTGDVDKSDVEGDVNTFIDVDGDTAVANSVFDWSDSNFTNINSAWLDYIYMTNPINDGNISDTLTLGSGSSVDKGALANTGTLGFDWADGEIADTLTLDSSSTIDGISATNLVDKSASETITGSWTFDSAILGFNNTLQSNGEGLVGYWAFDENTGTNAYDSSREGNDGTLYDANATNADGDTPPQWVSGKFGNALEFDGMDDYVDCGNDESLNFSGKNVQTIALWLYPRVIPGDVVSIAKRNNYQIYINGSGYVYYDSFGDAFTSFHSTSALTPSKWYHVVAVADGSNAKIFIDGTENGVQSIRGNFTDDGNNLLIGGYSGYYFNGTIDEVKIFNRSLTAQEIRAEYLLGLASHDASGNYVKKASSTTQVIKGNITFDSGSSVTFNDWINLKPRDSPPASPSEGDLYVDTSHALCYYNSTAWERINSVGTCS